MKIKGLIAATFSTLSEDGSVDTSLINPLIERLIKEGVKGVFICGTNGEGPSLTIEERMIIAEAYVKAVNKRMLVLVHVGHNSIEESKRLASHAAAIGADAISSVAGFYFKSHSVTNLVECMADIAAQAPKLPFYYYHIPAITGISIDMLEFLKQAEEKVPSFAGIKYTANTLHEYQSCLNYKNGKFDILYGYDEMLLSALAVGAVGAIGSTYNFAAPLYSAIIDRHERGNIEEARRLQFEAVKMIRCLSLFSAIPTQKAIVKLMGQDMGPCRLPLKKLNTDQINQVSQFLNTIKFFDTMKSVSSIN